MSDGEGGKEHKIGNAAPFVVRTRGAKEKEGGKKRGRKKC